MNRRISIVLSVAGLALAGCAGSESTFAPSAPTVQIDGFYSDGAGGRDLKLVVNGNPFAVPDDVFQRSVEADLRDLAVARRQPTNPLLSPGPSAKPLYRLVYDFNAPNGVYGDSICYGYGPAAVPPVQKNPVVAVAAFCVGYRAVSYISGQTPADGPSDVRLSRLVRDMTDGLFRPDLHLTGPNTQKTP